MHRRPVLVDEVAASATERCPKPKCSRAIQLISGVSRERRPLCFRDVVMAAKYIREWRTYTTVTSRCKLDLSRAVSTVGLFHQFCARYTPLDENHGQKLQKSSQTFSLQIAKFAANSQYRFTGTLCLKKHRIDKRFPLRKHG